MSGLYHTFIISKEDKINEFISQKSLKISEFEEGKRSVHIHDNYIQLLINKRYLVSVPSYDYKNEKLIHGLCTLGCTVFRAEQINGLYEKIELFESEIDLQENRERMEMFNSNKDDVLKNIDELKKLVLDARERKMCIFHFGI